jgi:hypothetical protein
MVSSISDGGSIRKVTRRFRAMIHAPHGSLVVDSEAVGRAPAGAYGRTYAPPPAA